MKSRIPEIEAKLTVAVDKIVKDSAERIAAQAKASAPEGATGNLKRSIDTRPGYGQTAQGSSERGTGVRYDVVAIWYWFLVEFGHEASSPGQHRPGRQGQTGRAAPHPFMIPAAEAERPRMIAEVSKRLRDL